MHLNRGRGVAGYNYVLTTLSFPEFAKIGYADDPERLLKDLSSGLTLLLVINHDNK